MNSSFYHFSPTKIYFGAGALENSWSALEKYENILLVSTRSAAEVSGVFSALNNLLKLNQSLIYRNLLSSDPDVDDIDNILDSLGGMSFDLVIGAGGGSAIDGAKAVAACLFEKKDIFTLLNSSNAGSFGAVDIAAIPTTSGTGSEVSKGAILSNSSKCWKGGLRGESILPKFAILDPQFTFSAGLDLTAECGFDVFTHAFESYLSNASTPITRLYSVASIQLVLSSLLPLTENLGSFEYRERMALASLLAGVNLANASTCLPHRMQYPLSAHFGGSHARGLASLYPGWLKEVSVSCSEKLDRLVLALRDKSTVEAILGKNLGVIPKFSNSEEFVSLILSLIQRLGLSKPLSEYGVSRSDCEFLANSVSGNLELDPAFVDKCQLAKIYIDCL